MTAAIVFGVAIAAGGIAVLWPYLFARVGPWPAETVDRRDDVARAVSSLRDLQFAEAAGTIDPGDASRLRTAIERSAFAADAPRASVRAPLRTIAVTALLVGVVAAVAAQSLPQEAGDRAPGEPITGTIGRGAPSTADLEARARSAPSDVPTLLALADAYRQDGRTSDAVGTYRAVLALDRDNVAALNGLALILTQAGETDGALLALDRVLTLRPKDPDALFLKGLILYQRHDYKGAVAAWTVYLDVGEFHPAAPMVRPLYADAKQKAGP